MPSHLTLEVAVADELNSLGVYANRFTSVATSLGSSANVTSSGINLSQKGVSKTWWGGGGGS